MLKVSITKPESCIQYEAFTKLVVSSWKTFNETIVEFSVDGSTQIKVVMNVSEMITSMEKEGIDFYAYLDK